MHLRSNYTTAAHSDFVQGNYLKNGISPRRVFFCGEKRRRDTSWKQNIEADTSWKLPMDIQGPIIMNQQLSEVHPWEHSPKILML